MGKVLTLGDLDIESFGVSHDAAAPQFYRFHKDGKSFVMLTDTGYCSDHVRGIIKGADAYLVESNHDLEMLRMGLTHGASNSEFLEIVVTYRMKMALWS